MTHAIRDTLERATLRMVEGLTSTIPAEGVNPLKFNKDSHQLMAEFLSPLNRTP